MRPLWAWGMCWPTGKGLSHSAWWVACCSLRYSLPPQAQRGLVGLRAGPGRHRPRGPGALLPGLRAGLLRPAGSADGCPGGEMSARVGGPGLCQVGPMAGRAGGGRGPGSGARGGRCQAPLPAGPRSPPRPSCTCATSGQTAPSCARPRATRPTPAPAAVGTLMAPLPVGQWHHTPIPCTPPRTPPSGEPKEVLIPPTRYRQEFGFTIPSRAILVDDVRVRGTASSGMGQEDPQPICKEPPTQEMVRLSPRLQAGLRYWPSHSPYSFGPLGPCGPPWGPLLGSAVVLCEGRTSVLFSISWEAMPGTGTCPTWFALLTGF